MFSDFASLDTFDKIATVAFLSAIAFAVIAFYAIFVAKKKRPEMAPAIKKGSVFMGLGYAVAFCVVMLFLTFEDMAEGEEIIPLLFYPILTGILLVVLVAVGFIFVNLLAPNFIRIYKYVALGLGIAELITLLACLGVYYGTIKDYYEGVSDVGLYIGAVIIILIIVAVCAFLGKKQVGKSDTKAMAFGAVSIALSFALSYIKFFRMPQGGSVTAVSMLPLMIYSYMFGIRRGTAVAFIYGLMQAIQDPWIIHPAQFLLDYPVAYGAIGLTGLLKEHEWLPKVPFLQLVLGGFGAGLLRYASHVISGALAFASYAPDTFSPIAWGFVGNLATLVDLAITLAVGGVLMLSKSFRRVLNKQNQN